MTNKTKLLIVACFALALGGCATEPKTVVKQWEPIKGNKDDGIVTLGYYYELPFFVKTSFIAYEQQGLDAAAQTCKTWGYETAVIYDIKQSMCAKFTVRQDYTKYCSLRLVSRNYQCQ